MTRPIGKPPEQGHGQERKKQRMPELTKEQSARVADQVGQYLKMPEVQRSNALYKASKKKPITDKVQ